MVSLKPRLAAWTLLTAAATFLILLPSRPRPTDAELVGLLTSVDRQDRPILEAQPMIRLEARANSFTAFGQDAATLATDGCGQILVAWHSRRQQEGHDGVYWQRFSPLGKRIGPERLLSVSTDPQQDSPALAAGKDAVWAAWQSFGQDGDGSGILLRRLDAEGAEIGVNVTRRGQQVGVNAAPGAHGGVTVAWIGPERRGRAPHAWMRLFDASGRPRSQETRVDEGAAPATILSLSAFPDGGFVIAWATANHGIRARLFGAGGIARGGSVRVDEGRGKPGIEPSVAAGEDGGFLVTWMEQSGKTARYAVLARRFDASAKPGAPLLVGTGSSRAHLSGAHAAISPSGRACLAWNESDPRGKRVIRARLWSPESKLGTPFTLASAAVRDQSLSVADGRACMSLGEDGVLAFAWAGDGGLGDDSGAHLTLLRPATKPAEHPWPQLTEAEIAKARALLARATQEPGRSGPARPHDPPVYDPRVPKLPHGGDSHPFSSSPDFGFVGVTNTGWTPPDPHLAAGPAHVVNVTNGAIAWFKKDGTKQFQQTISGGNGFWGGLGATRFVFDPEVIWDPHAKRFWAMAAERTISSGSGRSTFVVAVSDDADPNGTWHKYRLDVTALANTGSGGGDIDSPNIAVDAKVLYLSADFFRGGQKYLVYMLDKTPLLAGKAPTTKRSMLIRGSQSFGFPVMWTAAPALYMIEHFESFTNTIVRLHAITNPLTTPQRKTFNLTVPAYGRPGRVPQKNTTARITTFDARFWSAVFRNGSLWAAHHHGSRTLARWYEIKMNGWPASTSTPTLAQSGDVDPGPGIYTFFNSISVDAAGNALTTFARSAANEFISIGRAYRLAGDPKGKMRKMAIIKTNSTIYTRASRWGDYSQVSPDPAQKMTLWYTHEYAPAFNSWNTWIGKKTVQDFLAADVTTLSASRGGTINFRLEEPGHAGKLYILLGGMSGSRPGFKLPPPPGNVTVPLNWDGLTSAILANLTNPALQGFLGRLDANGQATAALTLPPIPALNGRTLDFAFAQDGTLWDFASNNVTIKILP